MRGVFCCSIDFNKTLKEKEKGKEKVNRMKIGYYNSYIPEEKVTKVLTEKERLEDKIDHITRLVDLEWNGQITRTELIRRLTDIVKKEKENK